MSNFFLFKNSYYTFLRQQPPPLNSNIRNTTVPGYAQFGGPLRISCIPRAPKPPLPHCTLPTGIPHIRTMIFKTQNSPALSERHQSPDSFAESPPFSRINASADLPMCSCMKSSVLPSKPFPARLFFLCFLSGRLQLLQIALEPRELCCSEIPFFAGRWALLTDFKRNSLFTNRLL